MRIRINKPGINRILTALVIVALFTFGDYSVYVYAAKVAAILGLLLSERVIRNGFHVKWVIAFLLVSVLSLVWSESPSNSVFYIAWIMQAMGLAVAIGNSVHSKEDVEYVLATIFVAGAILTLRILLNTSVKELGSFRLGTNMGYNANELSLKASIACIAGFYFLLKQDRLIKQLGLAGLCVLLGAVVLFTGSRKGSIMLLSGVVLYNILRSKDPLKFARNVLISLVFFAAFYLVITKVPVFYDVLGKRLLLTLEMFNADSYVGNSIANRMSLMRIGVDLFKNNPVIGYGIGSFSVVSGTGLYAHNNYIELLVDVGVIGAAVYYSMYIYNIRNLIRYLNRNRAFLALFLSYILIIVVLEYGLVSFQGDYVQIIVALCYACIRIMKNEQEGPVLPAPEGNE